MTSTCSICASLKKRTTPITWCAECGESFCQPCEDKHRLSELSKDHITISYKDYEQLPSIIMSSGTKCSKHQELFTFFCRYHDQPICKVCVMSGHTKCHDIQSIHDIVHNVKTSVLFEELMADVEHVRKTFTNAVKSRKANMKSLEDTRQIMHNKLGLMFDELIKQLTKIKQNTEAEIDEVIGQEQEKVSEVLGTVEANEQMFDNIFKQQDKIKLYLSNLQTFLGLKQIENLVFDSEKSLQKLSIDNKLDDTIISFEKYETVDQSIRSYQTIGEVIVSKSPSSVRIDIRRVREAQKELQRTSDVQLSLQQRIDLDNSGIYFGCCTLPNGMMIFPADITHRINIHNSDGSQKSTLNFSDKDSVFDVTMVDENHFAACHPESKTISIINTNSGQIVKKIKSEHEPYGISYDNGSVFVCVPSVHNKAIIRVSVDSEREDNVIIDREISMYSHISVRKARVCYTCPDFSTITVLDGQFNVLFKFKDQALLKEPLGVTIDQDANIYVNEYKTDKLIMISPNGKNCKQLLNEDDDLLNPTALDFEPKTRTLLVVNQKGPAFKYYVK